MSDASARKMHVAINVSDVKRAIPFYEALFGVPVNKVKPGYANFDLSDPPMKFALNEIAISEMGRLNHLGFQVQTTEDVLATKARLEQSGLITFDEVNRTCCYSRQDKIWVRDPDGNPWEVYVLLEDMEEAHDYDVLADSGEEACCADAPVLIPLSAIR